MNWSGARFLAACVVLAAGVGVTEAAWTGPHLPQSTVTTRTVSAVTAICPDVGAAGGSSTVDALAVASIGAPGAAAGRPGGVSTGTVGTTDPPFPPTPLLVHPGTAVSVRPDRALGAMLVDAHGSLAPGFSAEQYTRTEKGVARGWSSLSCSAPTPNAWYVGAQTRTGEHSELFLTNPDPVRASVDVTVWGPTGPVSSGGGSGIAVDPQSRRVIDLATIAPDVAPALIHVHVRSGRVASALRLQLQDGNIARGVDWVPHADRPSRSSVLPGFFPHKGDFRLLYLANPGPADGTAQVKVVAKDGSFVPTGLDRIRVPAGQVTSVDISSQVDPVEGALVVRSDQPLVVGSVIHGPQDPGSGIKDFALTAATPMLTSPGVVSGSIPLLSFLVLSAPDGAASVRISVPTRNGNPPAPQTVAIGAGKTVLFPLASLVATANPMAVAIEPLSGSGPVSAARVTYEGGATGALFTLLPIRPAPQSVRIPAVASDPEVAALR